MNGGSWTDVVNSTNIYNDIEIQAGLWEYQAVVQSGSCPAANSNIVAITLLPSNAGAITGGTSPLCFGSSTGTMTLSGYTGTVVKWQKHLIGGAWSDIANTAATYSEIPSSAGTWEYRAVVHNSADMTSATATIVVDATTVGGTVTGGTNICSGSTSGLLTLSGQTGNILKWQSSVSPFSVWTDIANTATTYTSGVLAQTTQFRAVVQNGSCSVANSSAATVTVNPTSVGGTVTGGTTPIILGQSIGSLVLSGQTGTVVNWRERLGAGAWINEINNSNSYSDIPNATGIWEYQALVQSGNCPAVSSTSVFITVNPSSEGAVTGGATPICLGSSTRHHDISKLHGYNR